MIRVRFFTLAGKFATAKYENFPTFKEALAAVTAYAEAGGYRKVKEVDDFEELDCRRFVATTPGGRGGRNVAEAEDWGDEEPPAYNVPPPEPR